MGSAALEIFLMTGDKTTAVYTYGAREVIRTTNLLTVRVRVTSRLRVYRQLVRLADNPLETHDQ
jgi:hypothetical protein